MVFAELDWTPGTLEQCEDRAHRIGQKDTVHVHYLVAAGSLDDWVWSALSKKVSDLNSCALHSWYPAIHSIGGIQSLLCLSFFVCTLMDFSSGALPIGVKFCMAVRPDLGQVFSYFGDSPSDGRILDVSRSPYGGICFLLKHVLLILSACDFLLSSSIKLCNSNVTVSSCRLVSK